MFKRLLWLIIGASFGFGMSFWVTRAVRQTVERYTPEKVSSDLASAVRALGADLKAAAAEGRRAMHEHEAVLRAQLESPNGHLGNPVRARIRALSSTAPPGEASPAAAPGEGWPATPSSQSG